MDRRNISKALIGSFVGAAIVGERAAAQSCVAPCYPQTPQELAAGVTPVDTSFPPGNVRRYGAVGDGSTDDRAAFVDAISSNRLVFVPASSANYCISAEIVVNRSDITIAGETKQLCMLRLTSSTANASVFRWTTYAQNVHIERLGFDLKNGGLTQKGIRFAELRSSCVIECRIDGLGTSSDDTTAIQFDGTGTFTGDVTIERCFLANHKIGIDLQGTCTTVRIVNCEMYGTSGASATKGVRIASSCSGTLITGCAFDQWVRGVYSEGAYVKQIGNYFESSSPQWEWLRGSGNARIWNQSIGDTHLGAGTPIFPHNDWDLCTVMSGPGIHALDTTVAQISRGVNSLNAGFSIPPLTLGSYRLWIDNSGKLRIKNGAPSSATDGVIVGTQS